MMTDAGPIVTKSSTFSATRSGRDCHADGMVLASCSAQRRATKLSKRFGRQFAVWGYMSAATSRLMIWRGCSTRISAAGSTTMAGTTSQLFTRPFGTSTAFWGDGLIGSSSPCSAIGADHSKGWSASRPASRICSLTGVFCRDAAEQWEPDEARVSRPFLRERGGETPPRHSPRYPQPRSRGGGIGVDEGGDDQTRVNEQRSEHFAEKRPRGTLRLPRLLVRRACV